MRHQVLLTTAMIPPFSGFGYGIALVSPSVPQTVTCGRLWHHVLTMIRKLIIFFASAITRLSPYPCAVFPPCFLCSEQCHLLKKISSLCVASDMSIDLVLNICLSRDPLRSDAEWADLGKKRNPSTQSPASAEHPHLARLRVLSACKHPWKCTTDREKSVAHRHLSCFTCGIRTLDSHLMMIFRHQIRKQMMNCQGREAGDTCLAHGVQGRMMGGFEDVQ